MSQITVSYTTEGSTDIRFLESIISRTFEDVAFECDRQIEVLPLIPIDQKPGAFVEKMIACSFNACSLGAMVLCIHVDADSHSSKGVYKTRINPLLEALKEQPYSKHCQNIVPVIPVQMTEAWMLADKVLFKEEVNTKLSDVDLGLDKRPETISDPKEVLENAIRIANRRLTRRRRHELRLSDLYSVMGQKISLTQLDLIPSFRDFKNSVREAYKVLNYLH